MIKRRSLLEKISGKQTTYNPAASVNTMLDRESVYVAPKKLSEKIREDRTVDPSFKNTNEFGRVPTTTIKELPRKLTTYSRDKGTPTLRESLSRERAKENIVETKVEKKVRKDSKEKAKTLKSEMSAKYGIDVDRANSPIEAVNMLSLVADDQKEQFKKDFEEYSLATERSNPFRAGADAGFNVLPTNLEKTEGKEDVQSAKGYGTGRLVGSIGQQAAFSGILGPGLESIVGKVLPKATPLVTETIKDVAIGTGTQIAEAPFDKPTTGQFVGNAAMDIALNVLFGKIGKGISGLKASDLSAGKTVDVVESVAKELNVSPQEANKVLDDAIIIYVNKSGVADTKPFEQLQLDAPKTVDTSDSQSTLASRLRAKQSDLYVNQYGVADKKPFEQLQLGAPKNVNSDASVSRLSEKVKATQTPVKPQLDRPSEFSIGAKYPPLAKDFAREVPQPARPRIEPTLKPIDRPSDFSVKKPIQPTLDPKFAKERPTTLTRDDIRKPNVASKVDQPTMKIEPTLKPKKVEVKEPINTLDKVMVDMPLKSKGNVGQSIERLYQETVSKMAPMETLARKTDTPLLRATSTNLNRTTGTIDHNISKYQSDMDGNKVGDSIQSIFKGVDEKTKPEFYDYALNKHNINRYKQEKPVFGETVTSEMSAKKAAEYEASNPKFVEQQKKVTKYFKNLMDEWAVKSGLVSEDTAKMLNEMYPDYVPTYRATEIQRAMGGGDGNFVSQVLKKAKGSEKDILPLDQQMAILTDRTIRNARKNEVMTMLDDVYQANPEISSRYISDVKKLGERQKVTDILDVGKEVEEQAVKNGDSYTVKFYRNGDPYQMTINKTLYESLATIEKDGLDKGLDVIRKYATNPFKSLITQKNPIFFIRNVMRDIPTALIYSNDSIGLVKNTPEALKEMLTNGKLWNQYQAIGGTRSGLFNYEKGVKIDFDGAKKGMGKKILEGSSAALEMANNMTETLPRFAEYVTAIKKGEPPMLALMRASEITTDFSRFGKQTKRFDAVVPYLNASVQGLDKFFRQMRDKPVQTMAKGGLVVSVPALILDQVNKDNEAYNEMSSYERNGYYHIPKEDGTFYRIPRSREVGVMFGTLFEWVSRAKRGQEVTGEEIKETLKSNFTPVNGFDSNILKPALSFIDIATGKNTDAKNYFGSNIVPESLQKYSPGQQYTEKTTSLSKALGAYLDVPPVAIDYLLDSYLGVVADIGMPLLTDNKKNAMSPLKNAFIADPVFKSDSVNKFYRNLDSLNKLSADSNKKHDIDSEAITPYEEYRNQLSKVSKELSEIRKEQKIAESKGNDALVRQLREKMNKVSKEASESLPTESELQKEFERYLKNKK